MNVEKQIRFLIPLQILLFVLGALAHAGFLPLSHPHLQARTAESIIAILLAIGLVATFVRESWGRRVTLAMEVLSLFGTLIGLTMILIGVGPRSGFDYALHTAMIISFIVALRVLLRPLVTTS
jgi:hypothetical protein